MDLIEIRPLVARDYNALYNLVEKNRARLLMYFPKTSGSITDLETARKYIDLKTKQANKREQYYFVVNLQSTGHMIGGLILKNMDWTVPKGEIAYFIDGEYEGRGITTKAVNWLVAHAFNDLQFEKLYVKFNPENFASKKVSVKNGFVKEGHLQNEYRTGTGLLTDVERYGLLKNNFANLQP